MDKQCDSARVGVTASHAMEPTRTSPPRSLKAGSGKQEAAGTSAVPQDAAHLVVEGQVEDHVPGVRLTKKVRF